MENAKIQMGHFVLIFNPFFFHFLFAAASSPTSRNNNGQQQLLPTLESTIGKAEKAKASASVSSAPQNEG